LIWSHIFYGLTHTHQFYLTAKTRCM
jgi:hypothetical protein